MSAARHVALLVAAVGTTVPQAARAGAFAHCDPAPTRPQVFRSIMPGPDGEFEMMTVTYRRR